MVVAVYVMIPVKPGVKKMVEERMKEMGTETFNETIKELARPKGLGALKELKGILKGAPPFVRDKRDRHFG